MVKQTTAPNTAAARPRRRASAEGSIMRVSAADLDAAMDTMHRLEPQTRIRMHDYFVRGDTMRAIAERYGSGLPNLSNQIGRVRKAMQKHVSSTAYVNTTVTLPLVLAHELQQVSDGIAKLSNQEQAEEIIAGLSKAVATAKKKVRAYADE